MQIKTKNLVLNELKCWQITLNSGAPVGEIHCKGVPVDGEVEIGYGINEGKFRGRGYMKEALSAVCEYILSIDGITSIRAETLTDNFASQNVLLSCGFEREGKKNGKFIWRRKTQQP